MNIESLSIIQNMIEIENRDVALIAAPGMGVTTFIENMAKEKQYQLISIDTNTILRYWDVEYKNRILDKNLVIHGAAISALMNSRPMNLSDLSLTDDDIFKTDLPKFLNEYGNNIIGIPPLFLVIDNFEKIDDDLSLVICNELKNLADYRNKPYYLSLKLIRFILAGAYDLYAIYKRKNSKSSPATHFCKILPQQFLLTKEETFQLVKEYFPGLLKSPQLVELVTDWAGGYIHYVLTFAKWILNEFNRLGSSSIQDLVSQLKISIQEKSRIPIYKYCYQNWEKVENDEELLDLLKTVISVGYVDSSDIKPKVLVSFGYLVERLVPTGIYFMPNKLIEFFVRERLAEKKLVLPLDEGINFLIPSLNSRAHLLILEIETQLRNFVADRLFVNLGEEWIARGLGARPIDGKSVFQQANRRYEIDKKSIYTSSGTEDSLLGFLDFSDLERIVKNNLAAFDHDKNDEFSRKLPEFLDELSYYRNRMAHNRPFTHEQINSLASRWKIIQKLMLNVYKN